MNIRRSNIWVDAKRAFSRSSFDPSRKPRVNFEGEDGEDGGGLRRELFSFLIPALATESGLFEGDPTALVPINDLTKLSDFLLVGKILSCVLVHGGPGPHCLSKSVAEYIVFGDITTSPEIHSVPDMEIQEKLFEVSTLKKINLGGGGLAWPLCGVHTW